jgi:hypothetical protein
MGAIIAIIITITVCSAGLYGYYWIVEHLRKKREKPTYLGNCACGKKTTIICVSCMTGYCKSTLCIPNQYIPHKLREPNSTIYICPKCAA